MNQSEIICGIYESVAENAGRIKISDAVKIDVFVDDLCQCMSDRSGQRIIVDEMQYEQPAMYEMCIGIAMKGKKLSDVLKAYGSIAVHFKDNPSVDISDWKWHGCSADKIYLEPVIRSVDLDKKSFDGEFHNFELLYKIDFGLNSQKPNEFKRVERRDIRGYVKK